MTTITWHTTSRGAVYRAASLRVLLSSVVTAPNPDEQEPAQWLEEVPGRHWVPAQLRWGTNGRPSTLTLRRVLGAGSGQSTRRRPEEEFCLPGDCVRLVEGAEGGPRGTAEREWFSGYVGQDRILVPSGTAAETYEVIAYGPEILLRGKVVSGQWHPTPQIDQKLIGGAFATDDLVGGNTFRSHLPVIFNQHGQPNASAGQVGQTTANWHLNGDATVAARGRTFEAPGRKVVTEAVSYAAAMWNARTAMQSLVEVIDGYGVISPESIALLPSELSDLPLGEVSVEGMNLLEALAAVLRPVGYGFCIEPWARDDGRHVLHVFELHGRTEGSRVRKPYMAPIDGTAPRVTDEEGQRAEVQRIEFARDNHNVVNDVTVVGDQKRQQVTLRFEATDPQLKPAWDTSEHDLADWAFGGVVDPKQWPGTGEGQKTAAYFDSRYWFGANGKAQYQHVFRSFAWNEDGAFNALIDEMADLSDVGGDYEGNYARRPRPVGPTFLRDEGDAKVRSFPPFVQLGIEGDEDAWIQVPAVIWKDRAGFTTPVNPLWRWHPYASEYARHVASGSSTLFQKYAGYSYLTLLYNALRDSGIKLVLRLVGSIESDEALIGRAARRVTSSWPMVAAKVVRQPRRFRHRAVSGLGDPFSLSDDRHETRDDSADAADYAAAVRDVMEDEVGHGSIVLRHITRAYAPGHVVPQTEGRVIDLTVRGGSGSHAPVIVAVTWDFRPGANKTELLLDTPLLRVMQ